MCRMKGMTITIRAVLCTSFSFYIHQTVCLITIRSFFSENVYVRAFGGIKSFGNKRYLNLSHIRPLKDSHEIFFHLLEAMTVTLIFSRGPVSLLVSSTSGSRLSHLSGSPVTRLNHNMAKLQIVRLLIQRRHKIQQGMNNTHICHHCNEK
jgi:hypothetical protein